MERHDIAIIGTGPAGLEAALTAKIRNKSILLIGTPELSEKISKTHSVKNYLGLPETDGTSMSQAFKKHLESLGIEITDDRIKMVYAMGKYFSLQGKNTYEAKSVIIATGATSGKLLEGEAEFLGRGVSYCATCDGNFYKGADISVISFSKEDKEEIEFLASLANSVTVYGKNDDERNFSAGNIKTSGEVPARIKGGMKAQGIETESGFHETAGIFIFRDDISAEKLVPGLEMEDGKIKTDRQMRTNLDGCFACGDCTGAPFQYIKAAGEGNVAALSACQWLSRQD